MESTLVQIQQLLESLPEAQNRRSILSALMLEITTLEKHELNYVASNLQLNAIFELLIECPEEEIAIICNIIRTVLSVTETTTIERYSEYIHHALRSPSPIVQNMILQELNRIAKKASTTEIQRVFYSEGYLTECFPLIFSEDISVMENVNRLLIRLGSIPDSVQHVLTDDNISFLQQEINENTTFRMRVYDLIIGISASSEGNLKFCEDKGLMTAIFSTLKKDDPLLQINVLNLLVTLALKPHGFHYLDSNGIMKYVSEKLGKFGSDSMEYILVPGYITFFWAIFQSHPSSIIESFPSVVSMLLRIFDSQEIDVTLLGVVIETLGFIATSIEGKRMIHTIVSSGGAIMEKLGDYIKYLSTELKIKALNSLKTILTIDPVERSSEIFDIIEACFSAMHRTPMTVFVPFCRLPFPDIKSAALEVVVALSLLPWGQKEIIHYDGLLEFLMDSKAEDRRSRELQFKVIENIYKSPMHEEVISEHLTSQMELFVSKGLYYEDVQGPQVATQQN